jgi:hypothetical protein
MMAFHDNITINYQTLGARKRLNKLIASESEPTGKLQLIAASIRFYE